jgi:diaminopimelate decarboxylase
VLVNRVIGEKTNWDTHFIVTDGSMAELIRPSLYDAYHHIGFIEPVEGEEKVYDIVGPICESSDFLGKERTLSKPHEGAGLVVYDTGAYGYAMSSNYNIKTRPAEYLVDGDSLIQIRREESFEDFSRLFTEEKII